VVVAGALAYIFLGAVLYARATNHWKSTMPREIYLQLVPNTNKLSHPGM
jgi:hypothetical protein